MKKHITSLFAILMMMPIPGIGADSNMNLFLRNNTSSSNNMGLSLTSSNSLTTNKLTTGVPENFKKATSTVNLPMPVDDVRNKIQVQKSGQSLTNATQQYTTPDNQQNQTTPTNNNTGVVTGAAIAPTDNTPKSEPEKSDLDKKRDVAHNIVSGASSAMTGIGMMQAVQGFSEQKSDAAAESDMAAHIATFKCSYDKGPTFKYSTEEIIIPGGDELLKYYTEYKTLADQLKVTKAALNLTPGIESQVVYDKAESGLYQNFATERAAGHYASVSRALMDSDSEDAAAWAAEKEKSQKRLAIGASVAVAGILTGVIGDKLIDKHYDNPSDDDVTPQEAKTFNECLKDEGNDSLTKSIDDGQTYSTNVYERYLDGPYLGMCKVVDNGDWCTERGSCIISGTSTCSQSYNNEAYGFVATNQNMKHGANDGRYCYCKMTSWTPNGGQQQEKISQWGFLKEYPDATNCARFCARHCGDDLEHRYSDIARYVFKN